MPLRTEGGLRPAHRPPIARAKARWKDEEGHEVAVTTQFHRTLTDYMKTLRKNGFVVSQIEEPRPVEGKLEPNDMSKLSRIPHTICVEALKLNPHV